MQWPQLLGILQGGYFLLTGAWPLIHIPSFEALTGPKFDKWLVRMVGALAVAIGAPLLLAASRGSLALEVRQIALMSAVAFAVVDAVYVARRRIRPIYLADAAIEGVFIVGWITAGLW
jgi:hypothetical protein